MNNNKFLASGFLNSVRLFPENNAVFVEGKFVKYGQLYEMAASIAAAIQRHTCDFEPKLTAVFAYRSLTAFSGILGSLLSGNGYVPLNHTFPVERTRMMLERSECKSIIIDRLSFYQLDEVIADISYKLILIFPDIEDASHLKNKWPQHEIIGKHDLEKSDKWIQTQPDANDIAYLLFTSGSTGIPKGVKVTHSNVVPCIDFLAERYDINKNDRLSQMFDMTFDVSVFDMFVSWEKGACVCCPNKKTLMKPGKFINDLELTLWFSVPSTIVFMKRFNILKPNSYPSLRWSLFAGEPLPAASVQEWEQAAPNSIIENLYGPTELTIVCTLYRWNSERSINECEMGIVPIGTPFPNMKTLIVDEHLKEVEKGHDGELLMTGPQMTSGYWKDPERTDQAFVFPHGKGEMYYRTGDRVKIRGEDNILIYINRVDFQVQIHGYRVELGEIEAVIREESGRDVVVALGWPRTESGIGGVEVFIEGRYDNIEGLYRKVSRRLPDYMIPSKFHFIDKIPLNVNGKYDRKRLLTILEEST
jgi:amino acid adenylation domain-containing protein